MLVCGEIIASGTPAEINGNAKVNDACLGAQARMLELRDRNAFYGKSHILQGVNF